MEFIRNEQFLREISQGLRKFGPIKLLEIGDGLLAIRWPDDENFFIYFDTGRWKLAVVLEERFRSAVFPPELNRIGVITAYLLQRELKTPEVVRIAVQLMLIPTARHYRLASER